MKIEELDCVEEDSGGGREEDSGGGGGEVVKIRAKRVLVGAGGRILFYPTLLYNVIRNRFEAEFRWWDEVDPFILLGAVPFPSDVPRLQQLGVRGVITLNEAFETLVPTSLYKEYGIDHLVIPTRDYMFAPSLVDICRAVDFIHCNASQGRITYVHCKAGRGRSTTIVLCYLIEYKHMTPSTALEYVRSRRPRVLLAPAQWQAVQEYSRRKVEFPAIRSPRSNNSIVEDGVLITAADLEGYKVFAHYIDSKVSLSNDDQTMPVIVEHVPESLFGEDEVLITEIDLQGYETLGSTHRSMIVSTSRASMTMPVVKRLSCLFSSLKSSSTRQSNGRQLQEIHAY